MTGIVYGSTMGNTKNAAKKIADLLGDSELFDVAAMTADRLLKYDRILLGSSTWGAGDLQDDWEAGIDVLKNADLSGQKVGFFGCGDQEMYPNSFVDALGILYEAVKGRAEQIIGKWPTDHYVFSNSAAVVDGEFVGLVLDEDNQQDMTAERIRKWVAALN